MKTKMFLAILIFSLKTITAQGILHVTTDKINYNYGDSMIVSVSMSNNTDTSFTLIGSSSCFMTIRFNEVNFEIMCTTDQHEFNFSPGMTLTWIWNLNPNKLGIPDCDGIQQIIGICKNLRDTVYITAPKFRGGIIAVGIKDSIPEEEYQKLRDSINATVIGRYGSPLVWEFWNISNKSIDSLIEKYSGDYRLEWIEAKRTLMFDKQIVTGIESEAIAPARYSLIQNYPNPFNPTTTIEYEIPQRGNVQIVIYDILGRRIKELLNEEKNTGIYFIIWNGKDNNGISVPSGTYFYQIISGNNIQTKKMILLK